MARYAAIACLLVLLGCSRARPDHHTAPLPSASTTGSLDAAQAAPVHSGAPSAPSSSTSSDAVSQASPSYVAGAPVPTQALERVDGQKLRKAHIQRLKSDRSPVTVLGGDDALALGQRLCEAVVPQRDANAPVLVKPNLCGFDGFKNPQKSGGDDGVNGRVTDAEFTRGVIRCLKARGHTSITIADGCGNSHAHWLKAVEISGYTAMAASEGVPLVALDDDGVFDQTGDKPGKPLAVMGIEHSHVPTLLMPQLLAEVLDHGLFISVPKIKAHRYAVVSLGIKGMQGTVMRSEATPAYNQKWRMHEELKEYLHERKRGQPDDRKKYVASLEAFAERMVDVLELSLPDVILAEGVPAMAGDGFQTLRKVPGGIAIGGTNPVLVDRVGAEYLGLWNNAELAHELGGHRTSPLIEIAARRYGVPLEKPPLTGDGVAALSRKRPVFFKALAPFSLPAPEPAPTAHALHLREPVAVDGKVDPTWDSATAVTWQTDYAGENTGTSTSARFGWMNGALFALFELSGAGLFVDAARPTNVERDKLYQEDCVELFLAPEPSRPEHYYEIELGPLGHFFDLEIDDYGKRSNTDWSSRVSLSTTSDPVRHTAIIEARFDAPELTAALEAGAGLPFALYRMEGRAPRQYLAWRPPRTPKPKFHVAEGFGKLVLDP